MAKNIKGLIFDIQRYAIHDGPGIRTTAFLKGCPLSCKWCANPESQKSLPEIIYLEKDCIHCQRCLEICPNQAILISDKRHDIDRGKCDLCGMCVENCPGEALQIMGRLISPEELFKEMATDSPFWERSNGGITISGGEPLIQFEFLSNLLDICKENRVHTLIETSLYAPRKVVKDILEKVDMVICDVKIMDPEKHKKYIGVSNKLILDNLVSLLKSDKEVLVRMPVIPTINDDLDNLKAAGRFLSSHRPGLFMEILPYHRLGESKYNRLGKLYEIGEIEPPDQEQMDFVKKELEKFGITLIKT